MTRADLKQKKAEVALTIGEIEETIERLYRQKDSLGTHYEQLARMIDTLEHKAIQRQELKVLELAA